MAEIEGLDGFAIGSMPTVDGDPIVVGEVFQLFRLDQVLFDASDQAFSSFSLPLDDEMMLPKGGCAIAVGIHRHRFDFDAGSLIDRVDHRGGGKYAMQAVCQSLCQPGRDVYACPILVGANGQVIGCRPEGCDADLSGGAVGGPHFNAHETAEKIGDVSLKDEAFGE